MGLISRVSSRTYRLYLIIKMADEPIKLTAKERAARRRQKLLNKDSQEDRIKHILEDRLEPGTDIQPRASATEETSKKNKGDIDPIEQITTMLGNKNGIPGMPGSQQNSTQPMPLPEKIADIFTTFSVTLFLVLVSNEIITKDSYTFVKHIPPLNTFNLLFTLMAFSASKYIVMKQSYTSSNAFANIRTFGSIMVSPAKLDLFLSGIFIFINALKNYALFLVMHVLVYNFVVPNMGKIGGSG